MCVYFFFTEFHVPFFLVALSLLLKHSDRRNKNTDLQISVLRDKFCCLTSVSRPAPTCMSKKSSMAYWSSWVTFTRGAESQRQIVPHLVSRAGGVQRVTLGRAVVPMERFWLQPWADGQDREGSLMEDSLAK